MPPKFVVVENPSESSDKHAENSVELFASWLNVSAKLRRNNKNCKYSWKIGLYHMHPFLSLILKRNLLSYTESNYFMKPILNKGFRRYKAFKVQIRYK